MIKWIIDFLPFVLVYLFGFMAIEKMMLVLYQRYDNDWIKNTYRFAVVSKYICQIILYLLLAVLSLILTWSM